ncbi:MAG: Hsp20/alpha crystallin family protein [Thermodesulfobacteriota bacterium]
MQEAAESSHTKYYKEVVLPTPVDPDKVSFSYKNGILEMKLRKNYFMAEKA